MRIKRIIAQVLTFTLFTSLSSFGQGAAPSSHLYYSGGNTNSDIWMNSVNVQTSTTYTYYSAMGWNAGQEGGGYCGIQDHPNGKAFIFSIWDPSNHLPIIGAYQDSGTQIENFGGEGTGLKSMNFTLGWSPNNWYNLVTRVWQYNAHTFFGFWSQDMNTGIWTHLVTMDYPVPDVTFKGNNDAFIEDWLGSGPNIRKVLFKDAWQRSTSGTWKLQKSANFNSNSGDATRNGIYDQAFNSGIEAGAFFMQTGGNTTHAFSGRSTNLSNASTDSAPTLTIGSVSSFQAAYQPANQTINMNWATAQTKSPQFSYAIEVFDNSSYSGNPVLTTSDKIPQQRTATLNASSLANGTYYARLTVKDIFDQSGTPVYATVTKTAGPTVVITSPVNNANFASSASITINASTDDTSGTITSVEFYNGATFLGNDQTAPYSFTWSNVGYGSYTITAKAINNLEVSSTSLPITVTVNSTCNSGGVAFGTSPAYLNGTDTYNKVFDGNTATYFDYAQANGGYAGLDFGQGKKMYVNTISFFPRNGQTGRMIGGKFQGCNTADFSSNVADFYTITTEPTSGAWQTISLTPTSGYRYVRYLSPNNGYCNVAEVKFCGDFSLPFILDIDDFQMAPKCSLYPNPSETYFNIKLTECEGKNCYYHITDMNGRLISEKIIGYIDNPVFEQEVNVQDLPSGTYLVIIHLDDQVFSKKVIVDKETLCH